jgi:hypothetical protein
MAPYPEWTLEESRAGTGLRWLVGHGRAWPVQDEPVEASERCEPAVGGGSPGGRSGCRRAAIPWCAHSYTNQWC